MSRLVKKIITVVCIVTLSLSLVPVSQLFDAFRVQAFADNSYTDISFLKKYFPDGSYWNHKGVSYKDYSENRYAYNLSTTNTPCLQHPKGTLCCSIKGYNYSGECGCNSFDGSTQCMAFARFVCNYLFGTAPNGSGSAGNGWKKTSPDQLKIGDYIRINGHSLVVCSVADDEIKALECNWEHTCQVTWTRSIAKSKLYGASCLTSENPPKYNNIIINESNSKINIKDCTIPYELNQGTTFEGLAGTISTNDSNGLLVLYATISDNNNNVVQKSIVVPSVSYGPSLTPPKSYSYSFKKLCTNKNGTIDFSKLTTGTYKFQLFVACAPKDREFNILGLFNTYAYLKSEYIKKTNIYEFSVSSSTKSPLKASSRSANGRTLQYDKNGNSYYTVSCVLGESSSGSYTGGGSSGSSGSGSSGTSSSYQYRSGYSTGVYKVRVNSGWTLNLREQPSASSRRLGSLSNGSQVNVTAIDGEWGYTNGGWINLGYTNYVSPLPAEVYNAVKYETGTYVAVKESGINVHSGAGTAYGIVKTLEYNTNFNIDRVDGSWGYSPDQGGWLCLNYAGYISPLAVVLPKPEAPVISTTTGSDIAVGDIIEVTWSAVDNADSYTLNLVDSSNGRVIQSQSGVTGTKASFTVPSAGTYNVTINGVNGQKTGYTARVSGITAHAPVTVTFKNWDGSDLNTQQVKYGGTAVLPSNPSRTGYTFASWTGKYENVRENSTVTATFTRNSYTVTFYDYDGSTVLKTQSVLYEDAATAPAYSAPTGYSFVEWDKSFDRITENTSVRAVINWTSAYPLEIDTTSSIVRNNTAYITTAIVNNSPNAVSNAKVIVSLKTAEGKELAEAVSSNLSLAAGEVKTLTLTATYDGASTVGNIFVVKADDEKIPLAKSLVVSVDQGTAWSGWSTSTPPSTALKTQSRTEFRYRTKSYTTSSQSSLSGWTLYNTTSAYSDWSGWSAWQDSYVEKTDLRDVKTQQAWAGYSAWGGWSDWQDASVSSNDYRDVETREVVASSNTTYHYFRYTNSSGAKGNDYYSSTYPNYDEISLGSALTERSSTVGGSSGQKGWKYWYNGTNYHTYWECSPCEVTTYTYKTQYRYRTRSDTYKTQYSYRTRSLIYTYYYYKWSDWSGWSTSAVTGNSDKEVQTRTTYRYISNTPANIEDTTGTLRTISGNIGASYSGKYAILHVFSSDGVTQYIGQTAITSTGAYEFVFKLKNEPTVESGDYYVTLSVEGNTAAIALDPILAPVPTYTVTFKNYDGNILESQQVRKSEDAIIPASPERAGYRFTGWSETGTNIQEDTVITAQFSINEFDVVFVDELAGTRETIKFNYGDELTCPVVAENEVYDFVGWDAVLDGVTEVTENLIVRATYQIKTFTVKFLDYEGNEIQSSTVMFGDGVEPPTLEDRDGFIFVAWDRAADLDYITEDITIEPYFEYATTVEDPSANIGTGSYNSAQTITLTSSTEGASIYYTIDGSDPLEIIETSANATNSNGSQSRAPAKSPVSRHYAGTLYTGPFTLDSSAELTYVAVKDNMNISDYGFEILAINTPSTSDKQHLVTIHYGLYDYTYSYLVDDNATVVDDEHVIGEYGYTLVGAYTDAAMTNAWNLESGKVNESVDVYLKWEKNNYNVTFLDKDGNTIDTQSVAYMDSAQAPGWNEIATDGFTFMGWSEDFTNVTEDLTVQATYLNNNELTSVSLSQDEVTLAPNATATITATVSLAQGSDNNHIIWQSDDEDVVRVDENGVVTAVSNGTATVYAVSDDSGLSALCIITVQPDNPCLNGHTYGEWIIDRQPSCTVDGQKHRDCINGDHTETASIPATGHVDNDGDGYCDTCHTDLSSGGETHESNCVCGKYHTGPMAGFIKFFHKIIYFFKNLFGKN